MYVNEIPQIPLMAIFRFLSNKEQPKTITAFKTRSNKGYNYPMICALVKFNFRYEFESLQKSPLRTGKYGSMLIFTDVSMYIGWRADFDEIGSMSYTLFPSTKNQK